MEKIVEYRLSEALVRLHKTKSHENSRPFMKYDIELYDVQETKDLRSILARDYIRQKFISSQETANSVTQ